MHNGGTGNLRAEVIGVAVVHRIGEHAFGAGDINLRAAGHGANLQVSAGQGHGLCGLVGSSQFLVNNRVAGDIDRHIAHIVVEVQAAGDGTAAQVQSGGIAFNRQDHGDIVAVGVLVGLTVGNQAAGHGHLAVAGDVTAAVVGVTAGDGTAGNGQRIVMTNPDVTAVVVGAAVGDEVSAEVPSGVLTFKILEITK